MKFSVTKMKTSVYKWFYSKDLLLNIQGNNLSIEIMWPRKKNQNFNLMLILVWDVQYVQTERDVRIYSIFHYLHCFVTTSQLGQ